MANSTCLLMPFDNSSILVLRSAGEEVNFPLHQCFVAKITEFALRKIEDKVVNSYVVFVPHRTRSLTARLFDNSCARKYGG